MLATDKQQEQMWFFWLGVPLHLGGPDSARISFLEKCIPRNRKQAGAPFRSKLKLVTHNSFQNKQMAGIGLGRKRSTGVSNTVSTVSISELEFQHHDLQSI